MKLKIDFDNKVINVEENTNLGEFVEKIEQVFPDGEWKHFTLSTNVYWTWSNPIVIDPAPYWTYPYWYTNPVYSTTDGSGDFVHTTNACFGTYNIDLG